MNNKFKVGDKVVCTGSTDYVKCGVRYTVVIVDDDTTLKVEGSTFWHDDHRFELVVDERQALSDAIALVQKYKIGVSVSNSTVWSQEVFGSSHNVTIRQLLDKLFPPVETKEQVKLKELEEKQLLIADEMKKLRESMV